MSSAQICRDRGRSRIGGPSWRCPSSRTCRPFNRSRLSPRCNRFSPSCRCCRWGRRMDGNFAMMDEHCQPVAWNNEARISCEFSFKCPKTWERLSPTDIASIRHCSECDRDVHLALTEEDFRRHANGGHCVAVRVLTPDAPEGAEPVYFVGSLAAPYGSHLKKI